MSTSYGRHVNKETCLKTYDRKVTCPYNICLKEKYKKILLIEAKTIQSSIEANTVECLKFLILMEQN